MNQVLNEKLSFQEELVSDGELMFDEEFAFEIEELDSNRAMMLIVALDPVCPTSCH